MRPIKITLILFQDEPWPTEVLRKVLTAVQGFGGHHAIRFAAAETMSEDEWPPR